jgi:hypothetical protein
MATVLLFAISNAMARWRWRGKHRLTNQVWEIEDLLKLID